MPTIAFGFRDKLNAVLGGEMHSYCFQCGACVGDCPAARYSPRFNPRMIMLKSIMGLEEELLGEDSVIWLCTNCYNCYERCPQDVRPVEVIIALKNLARAKEHAPQKVASMVNSVKEQGLTASVTSATERMRAELGLPPLPRVPVEELRELM
ncbi:MAG: 4Fe-4S dicluster domain-containing protein [candidate division KSB1 bacterium]|nr:4Fe-4S dicluster domain-containing protein [candidate division KSB1 bacterium]MDZ7293943.1 4Fe-4S dicluster domain-containing protein [candidate division KSB1 bacterium]MDZ7338675.1 4Fe-4S dicluster domain-containing protein [candidate division KSB1 bacterium]MDZ7379753.1 4Fe-4S dicluster domain-containing protein [candidate division KSB1 bacterium]MDZ7385639.1 4Fe-4S dicluster domain-containing protein [candidate division KSB1 bacterium]